MALKCFDIVRRRDRDELYLVYQSDFLSHLDTRLVVPIVHRRRRATPLISKLNPLLVVSDAEHILLTHLAFAARVADFGPVVGNAEDHRDEIRDAFDLLTVGF